MMRVSHNCEFKPGLKDFLVHGQHSPHPSVQLDLGKDESGEIPSLPAGKELLKSHGLNFKL